MVLAFIIYHVIMEILKDGNIQFCKHVVIVDTIHLGNRQLRFVNNRRIEMVKLRAYCIMTLNHN